MIKGRHHKIESALDRLQKIATMRVLPHAGVAQLVERLTCNEDVAGSTPVSGSILKMVNPCPDGGTGRRARFRS